MNPKGEPAQNEGMSERLSSRGRRGGAPSRKRPSRKSSVSQGFRWAVNCQHFYYRAALGDWEAWFGRGRGGMDLNILGKGSRGSNLLLRDNKDTIIGGGQLALGSLTDPRPTRLTESMAKP